MLTAVFNFPTGTGGKTRILNELIKTENFNNRKVVVVSHCREMAEQNKRLMPAALSVTAFELVRKFKRQQFTLEVGTVFIVDSLPGTQVKLLRKEIDTHELEVWLVNQNYPFSS